MQGSCRAVAAQKNVTWRRAGQKQSLRWSNGRHMWNHLTTAHITLERIQVQQAREQKFSGRVKIVGMSINVFMFFQFGRFNAMLFLQLFCLLSVITVYPIYECFFILLDCSVSLFHSRWNLFRHQMAFVPVFICCKCTNNNGIKQVSVNFFYAFLFAEIKDNRRLEISKRLP